MTDARTINDAFIQIAILTDEAECLRRVAKRTTEDAGEIATRLAEIRTEIAACRLVIESR